MTTRRGADSGGIGAFKLTETGRPSKWPKGQGFQRKRQSKAPCFDFRRRECDALWQRRRCRMQRVALIVAAALGGWAITTLTVATLALGAGDTRDALVTLQVAPRGPGQVSAVPVAGGTPQECTGNRESNDCTFTYER